MKLDYDYIVIGSGFGGSVSALRLSEKGYSVLVLEKGKRLTAEQFPKTNWNLKRWFWLPSLKFFGLFKLTFFAMLPYFQALAWVAVRWFMPIPYLSLKMNSLKPKAGPTWLTGKLNLCPSIKQLKNVRYG